MQTLHRIPEDDEIDLLRPGVTKLSSGGAVIKQLVAGLLGVQATPMRRYRAPLSAIAPPEPVTPKPQARTAATATPPVANTPTAAELAGIQQAQALTAERDRLKRQLAAAEREESLLEKRKAMHLESIATPGQAKFAAGLQVPQHPKPAPRTDDEARGIRAGLRPGLRKFAASLKLPGQK